MSETPQDPWQPPPGDSSGGTPGQLPPPPPGQWGPPPGQPPGQPGQWGPPPGQPGQPPPYGPGPYAQPGYGQPYGYPYGPGRQTEGTAIAVLILAISAFVFCPLVPAIVAVAMAPGAKRKIAESGGMKDGEGLITAGQIIAWIHLGLIALVVIVIVIVAASGGFDSTNDPYSVSALLS